MYERITANDVQVGDRIARTRNDYFPRVIGINEGPSARRFALEYVGDDRPSWLNDEHERIYGRDAGNIRPRRTAKLWRRIESS